MSSLDISIGALFRKEVRYRLESLKFHGHEIKWMEYKRFLDSDFSIEGSEESLATLKQFIRQLKGIC